MRCWAFPDPERQVFDQVVLMGYRKADPVPDAHAEGMALEWAAGEPHLLQLITILSTIWCVQRAYRGAVVVPFSATRIRFLPTNADWVFIEHPIGR